MKNSLIIIAISSLSLGGLLLNNSQPSAEAKENNIEYHSSLNTDSLQYILDSIGEYKQTELKKYVTEIEKSVKVVEKEQEKCRQISMQVDLLSEQVDTVVIDSVIIDTINPVKKQSWFKKQINKLKNK